jgi:hypothetical protein
MPCIGKSLRAYGINSIGLEGKSVYGNPFQSQYPGEQQDTRGALVSVGTVSLKN